MQAEIRYSTRSRRPRTRCSARSPTTAATTSSGWSTRTAMPPARRARRSAAAANPGRSGWLRLQQGRRARPTLEKPTESGASRRPSGRTSTTPTATRSMSTTRAATNVRTHITYDHRDQVIAVEDPLGRMTCLEHRADERVVAETTPRGTAGAPARCPTATRRRSIRTTAPSTRTTPRATCSPGPSRSRGEQYGRTDADLKDWKVTVHAQRVGDADHDHRRARQRVQQHVLRHGRAAHDRAARGGRSSGRAGTRSRTPACGRERPRPHLLRRPGRRATIVERTGRSANAARSDSQPEQFHARRRPTSVASTRSRCPDMLPIGGPHAAVLRRRDEPDRGPGRALTSADVSTTTRRSLSDKTWPVDRPTGKSDPSPVRVGQERQLITLEDGATASTGATRRRTATTATTGRSNARRRARTTTSIALEDVFLERTRSRRTTTTAT